MTFWKRLKATIAAVVVAVAVMFAGGRCAAYAIVCVNCGTEWTQLLNNFELIQQLEQQVELVRNAIKQYQLMLTNSNPLANQTWGEAVNEMRKLNSLLSQAKSLSFTSGNLDGQFAQKYRTYNDYVSSQIGGGQLDQKFQQWSEDTNSSVLTTMKAAKLESDQIEGPEDTYLQMLQQRAETAAGQMQALQVGNQITLALARQLQKLRQLMLVQLQVQANFIQRLSDQEATQSAAWKNFTKKPNVTIGNGTRY